MASSRQNALSNRAAVRRKTWLTTRSIKLNSVRSARSASLSESELDWGRRSAFFWLAMAVTASEWESANKTEKVRRNRTDAARHLCRARTRCTCRQVLGARHGHYAGRR